MCHVFVRHPTNPKICELWPWRARFVLLHFCELAQGTLTQRGIERVKTLAVLGLLSATCLSCSRNDGGNSDNGGRTSVGGLASGGVNSSGGTSSSIGSLHATGGSTTGGLTSAGAAATGGHPSIGGLTFTDAASSTGGNLNTGGSNPTGGAPATGGVASTGGSKATGGVAAAGGITSTGGSRATGGVSAAGGATNTGGSKATGGASTGGSSTIGCASSDTTYKLVWSDEFNGAAGAALDSSKWTYDVGGNGWGNSELEYYTSGAANASIDGNGNLVITAKNQSMSGMNYTSARIKTQGLASWTYGRIEARIKIPKGQGMWPAFWLLGTNINSSPWPSCGEIDVMENVGKEPAIVHGSMHGPGYSGSAGPTAQVSLSAPVGDDYHVFAIEWEQNVIRWYVNDTLYSTKSPSDIPAGDTWVYSHAFFILLNVAVGGTWPGNPDSTTVFPQQMLVDYVRVCQH